MHLYKPLDSFLIPIACISSPVDPKQNKEETLLKYILTALAAVSIIVPAYAAEIPPSNKETTCIALAIQKEAGNQSFKGMKAVGHVIINRTKSNKYPDTPCRVINQKNGRTCQFSWVCAKNKSTKISEQAFLTAKKSLEEPDFTNNSISFHVKSTHPRWTNLKQTMSIGAHIFYAANSRSRKTNSDFT